MKWIVKENVRWQRGNSTKAKKTAIPPFRLATSDRYESQDHIEVQFARQGAEYGR